jgi:hypothetical protein
MYEAQFEVRGIGDLMFGRAVRSQKKDSETHEQFEWRTWKEKVPTTDEGHCYMNPFAVTNSLVEAASWLKQKVPGEGQATFTKRFRCGVGPGERVMLFKHDGTPLTIEDIDPVVLFVPSDGKHGGSSRVHRIFPTAHEWAAKGSVYVFDGKIDDNRFEEHMVCAGQYIGWGSMRAGNGGINGRYKVERINAVELEAVA